MPRSGLASALLLILLASACTAPADVHALELAEHDADAVLRYRTIPDARAFAPAVAAIVEPDADTQDESDRPARYTGPPRLRLEPLDRSGDHDWCDDTVIAEGFPAMRDDGQVYVVAIDEIDAGSDIGGRTVVQWRNVADDGVVTANKVYDGEDTYALTESDPEHGCTRARARIAKVLRPLNEGLATGWRSLIAMPVQLPAPPSWDGEPPAPARRLAERPVDVLYRNGYFIARVQDAKVLQKLVKTEWLGTDPEYSLDAYEPTIMGLFRDPATGFAVAMLSYETGSCMSDPTLYPQPIALAPEVVAEAERRAAFVRTWAELAAARDAAEGLDEDA